MASWGVTCAIEPAEYNKQMAANINILIDFNISFLTPMLSKDKGSPASTGRETLINPFLFTESVKKAAETALWKCYLTINL